MNLWRSVPLSDNCSGGFGRTPVSIVIYLGCTVYPFWGGSDGGHYSVDYLMLSTHLIGAIKELKAEVDSLKNVSHSHS